MAEAIGQLEGELRRLGLHLRTDWVRACLGHLRSADPSFGNRPLQQQVSVLASRFDPFSICLRANGCLIETTVGLEGERFCIEFNNSRVR